MMVKALILLLKRGSITIFLLSVLLFSCGIDTIAYLSSKVTGVTSTASAINFLGPNDTNPSYLGVFIFYRIYDSDTVASNDYANLYAKQNAANAVPGRNIESYLLSPSGLNYKKLVFDNESPIPTLTNALLNSSALVSISFPSSTSVEPTITITSSIPVVSMYNIQRYIPVTINQYLSFRNRPQVGQDDYTASADDPDPNEYFIQFFAASYGLDLSDISELYGDAVFLGKIIVYL